MLIVFIYNVEILYIFFLFLNIILIKRNNVYCYKVSINNYIIIIILVIMYIIVYSVVFILERFI